METTVERDSSALRAIGFREHLEFFDEDRDQKISLREARRGLERLGFGYLLTVPAAAAINVAVSGLGFVQGFALHPSNVDLDRTGFVRHPDTDFIDDEGSFDDARLDDAFARYGRTFDGDAVTLPELAIMLSARVVDDSTSGAAKLLLLPVGLAAIAAEWAALFWVAASIRNGTRVLEKETVRRFYTDPEFLHDVARRIEEERAARGRSAFGRFRNFVQQWLI